MLFVNCKWKLIVLHRQQPSSNNYVFSTANKPQPITSHVQLQICCTVIYHFSVQQSSHHSLNSSSLLEKRSEVKYWIKNMSLLKLLTITLLCHMATLCIAEGPGKWSYNQFITNADFVSVLLRVQRRKFNANIDSDFIFTHTLFTYYVYVIAYSISNFHRMLYFNLQLCFRCWVMESKW